ncbi:MULTISPECIES: hypothetical protein [Bradyrhizobium]|uniref:hypothetical protein n=1 Tax=Bradyrhizobium TaxID=374 RepID=UPI000481B5EB|nr:MULTISPECIES: hypothetical protein [Bradyrhizobium]UFW51217.1 hypothetical protein BaraCB756_09455 [Bradyrhizobium arachidis]
MLQRRSKHPDIRTKILSQAWGERRWQPPLACIATVFLAGCSLHPVQQDVTGVRTSELVQYIRCESRLAIQDKAIALFRKEDLANPLIDELSALRGRQWPSNLRTRLNGIEQVIYDRYIRTGIAYDFSFDITEDNGASGVLDPVKLFTNGAAGLGLSASGDFRRENLRHFVVSETAEDLLENGQLECGPSYDYKSSNYTYPIAGKIGIDELVSTFFEINEIKNLSPDKTSATIFADTLTFTTTITGSASPHVIVAPSGNRWGLASAASLGISGSRVDKHALIIGLSLDTMKRTASRQTAAAAIVAPGLAARSALQRSNVRSANEQSALDAVTQARLDAYLDRAFR